jgi:anhydro-N-acetylmuramic acid kinase
VLNLGGIGNLTAIPAAADAARVRAFDTGPGNMVIDAVCEKLFGQPFDKAGKLAAKGSVLEAVLDEEMKAPFFRNSLRKPGPRTAGREQFGREYVRRFLQRCGDANGHDVLATATALTARSIGEAIRGLAKKDRYQDLFVSGGGTRNRTLMAMIRSEVEGLGIEVATTDAAGVPSQAKEAIAFALLAYQSWQGETSNIPGATGAGREVILGKLSYA